ncbi:DNA phosphorothioation-dependent restriction protein DptH [Maledivibacter halophilus]|uniref:DNA phosphorothioation-dependent restriction protein DptH n=1 Tax=Maledivibacter halophilus TaxID=36842 RepID=A0A1T5LPR0_9FIRM|nr:DNA phosphorothioation-dependent restriction protein DptH [Maledivibacter halophilus]SKC77549.1 DNA phosphorothioation-dependent restriction protein DptH [Maledivibacter halophilus]
MLNQFYNYLSDKVINFFRSNSLGVGDKYNIQFETEDQVRKLYKELKEYRYCQEFQYKDRQGNVRYTSYMLNFNKVKLIIAATVDDIQPDFLTRLRNMVGVEEGYKDKAIIFIHNSNLDSIIGGTESFNKEGMPFHITSLENDIKKKLVDASFSEVDKKIIEFELDRKKRDAFLDNTSVFEYMDLLSIVNEACIKKEYYKNFGLFYDSKIKEFTGEKLKKRIKENALYFNRVDEIHNYGNPDTQLEKYFDERGISKLKGEEWKSNDFKDIEKSIENKKNIKYLEYIGCNTEWDKPEGDSTAKLRIRNIIVFSKNREEKLELEFRFDDFLKQEKIRVFGDVEAIKSGKKLKVVISNILEKTNFYKVIYQEEKNIKFEFKILLLNIQEKYLESIKTKYSLNINNSLRNCCISLNTDETEFAFNEFQKKENRYEITENGERIALEYDETLLLKISDTFQYDNDNGIVKFELKINDEVIPIRLKATNQKVNYIGGLEVWKLKREKKINFKLVGDNRLKYGTNERYIRDEFKKNIELEKEIIQTEGLYFKETFKGVEVVNINIDREVNKAYNAIIEYYKLNGSLPSLTFLNDEIKKLYMEFMQAYECALNRIEEGSYLGEEERNLLKIGTIKREIEEEEILHSPLSPLNIAYQLHIDKKVVMHQISQDIIKKLTSTYLLPYISGKEERLYIAIEQHHSPEWKYYVDEKLPRYKSSRNFVSKLISEKIQEFIEHFKYIFNMGDNTPIKINLINTGDSKEILEGIFKYYIKQLKNKNNILPIELFIYSNKNVTNAFEEVAFNDDIHSLKEIYNLDLNIDNMSEEDILNLYRENVQFYSKRIEDGVEYSHITFIEMNNKIKSVTSKMEDIPSGVILDGLISGIPSAFLGDSYRTGFGTKYAKKNSNLMETAVKVNALNAALSGEPFNSTQCKAISMPSNSNGILDEIYDASHWVTFIDPKVDLNFFKNDPGAKDLLIIHYSDQYTTVGGYDAITVTRKSGPYQKVIEEFLYNKGIENVEKYSPIIINMFNAINGDWLLRLLSSKSYFPKEKISILSAIKLALAEFKKHNIIWVPISLEEVLRISGGAGLKQTDAFISLKDLGIDKSGYKSDDILLFGIEALKDRVIVHFYPIEVKIGNNKDTYIDKGVEQVKSTKDIFCRIMLPIEGEKTTSIQKIYRNFLMQLVIISAEKLNLYDVCNEENWEMVMDSDLRKKLLNEEYQVTNIKQKDMGEGAVISFKRGATCINRKIEDDILVLEVPEDSAASFLTKSIHDIRNVIGKTVLENINIEENNINLIDLVAVSQDKYCEMGKEIQLEENRVKEDRKEVTDESSRSIEILFGHNWNNNKEVIWYPNDTDKVFHTNTGIIGTMGTGKTQFTKSIITQIYREMQYNVDGKQVGILIFDYKGDYNKSKMDFVNATNADIYKLFKLPFNPFTISLTDDPMPMLPYHIGSTFAETIVKAFGLGKKQEALLEDLIEEAYSRKGILSHVPDTWKYTAPTLKDVYDIYEEREDIKKDDSLYAAFRKLIKLQIFEPNANKTCALFDLINGVTVIDLSGYDTGTQNLVVAITLDLFYSQMQAHGHSKIQGKFRQLDKIILVDEADNFLSKNFTSIKNILKEGREFGVGTILSTQLLSHFSTGENDYANYILTWVIHNVSDLSNKDVKYIFNTQNKQEEERLYNKIKSLNKHYSLVKMKDEIIHMKDKAFWQLIE